MCSLLQVSSTCRRAVRQSRANCTISSTACPSLRTVLGLSRFAAWLSSGHAGLVSGLSLNKHEEGNCDEASTEIVQHSLTVAVRSATAAAVQQAEHPADTAASSGPPGGLLLQLEYFKTDYLAGAALLSALASAHLQRLCLRLGVDAFSSISWAALSRLHLLQQLAVEVHFKRNAPRLAKSAHAMQGLCVHLQELQHLTRLALEPVDTMCFEHFPVSLREVEVQQFSMQHLPANRRLDPVNLRHLTNLDRLSVVMWRSTHAQLLLPPQLTHLRCSGRVGVLGQHGLLLLQALLVDKADWGILQCLATHQQPCKLEVAVGGLGPAEGDASGMQLCTALTSLHLAVFKDTSVHVSWCQYVQKLTNLVELDLRQGTYQQEDLMQLSVLTRLTSLSLNTVVDDAVAITLVPALTGLRELGILGDALRSAAVIPAAARLPNLESLGLGGEGQNGLRHALTPSVLNRLLPLTQLTSLCMPLDDDVCSQDAQLAFVVQMPGLLDSMLRTG